MTNVIWSKVVCVFGISQLCFEDYIFFVSYWVNGMEILVTQGWQVNKHKGISGAPFICFNGIEMVNLQMWWMVNLQMWWVKRSNVVTIAALSLKARGYGIPMGTTGRRRWKKLSPTNRLRMTRNMLSSYGFRYHCITCLFNYIPIYVFCIFGWFLLFFLLERFGNGEHQIDHLAMPTQESEQIQAAFLILAPDSRVVSCFHCVHVGVLCRYDFSWSLTGTAARVWVLVFRYALESGFMWFWSLVFALQRVWDHFIKSNVKRDG